MRQRDRRKRRVETQESRDRWMITYADLITLLLIFFIILYAMSSLDTDKYSIVTSSLSETFKSSSTVVEGGNGTSDAGKTPANKQESTAGNTNNGSDEQTGNQAPSTRELAFREQEAKLADLMGVITQYVQENHLGEQIFVADKPQGIEITLSDRFLFDVGKADLKSPALPALQQLSGLFSGIGATISIEGHTDNTPISSTSRYKDNWELSGARALSVLRFFLENEGLNPDTFQYAGYADTRPTVDNNTVAGKQKNRRVEIIVLRQLQEME
jgi:chemotaxis protein MotB